MAHSASVTKSCNTSQSSTEVVREFRFFKVYSDGRIEKSRPSVDRVPPATDPNPTGIQSKDITVSSQVSVRIFKPSSTTNSQTINRLPVIFYVHGGGFCLDSAFSARHNNYVSTLVDRAHVMAVSVDYGLFPERPLPGCYEDSWAALEWVVSHADGSGPEAWLNSHADFGRVFLIGNSAGGNICHYLAARMMLIHPYGVGVVGMVLIHPYFGGTDDDRMWLYMFAGGENGGLEDPRLKPARGDLEAMLCERVLVFVGELDHLRDAGKGYCEELKRSGWKGKVELVENEGEGHCFYWFDFNGRKSREMIDQIAFFINHDG
ncbi:hypothetical protein Droror1_Dr00000838 [Drosera rotundifolia]